MAQIEQGGDRGKKKKGAQKKIAIHVDFTPMVDMNMLLITFFMLCTTMIKSQTLSVILPAKPDPNNTTEQTNDTKVNESQLITMVIETERDENGNVMHDGEGKPKHTVYYYFGFPATVDENGNLTSVNPMKAEKFIGNEGNVAQGIRKILAERNADILKRINEKKQEWREKKITREEFQQAVKEIKSDEQYKQTRPIISIKPADDASWGAAIAALDEMQINGISVYQIEQIKPTDEAMIKDYKATHPE